MQIYRLPVLSDNYIFVLHDARQGIAAVVDPAEAIAVLQCLQDLSAKLVAIFNTHHHSDHVGGNRALLHQFPQAVVYGGEQDRGRIPGQQVFLQEGDRVNLGDPCGIAPFTGGNSKAARSAEVLFVPGHTRAHIAYYFPPQADDAESPGELFCGDTLFSGGCGRLFEGTPAQMVASLSKIRALPDSTRVWCAHEYTLNNLRFALTVEADNLDLHRRFDEVQELRGRSQATIPAWLGNEKRTNPFLRWDQATLQRQMKSDDPIQTFARLRGQKDQF